MTPEEKKPEPEAKPDDLSDQELDQVAGGGVGTTPSSRKDKDDPTKPGVPINF